MQKIRDMKNQGTGELISSGQKVLQQSPERQNQQQIPSQQDQNQFMQQQQQQIHALESRVQDLLIDNENLQKRCIQQEQQFDQDNGSLRRNLEYLTHQSFEKEQHFDKSIGTLIQEIERLNRVIVEKDGDLQKSHHQINELLHQNTILQQQLNSTSSGNKDYDILKEKQSQLVLLHEEEVNSLRRQLNEQQEIQRRNAEATENKVILLTTEIERLTQAIKQKDEELNQNLHKNGLDQGEVERLKSINRTQNEELEQYKLLVRNLQNKGEVNEVSNQELSNLRYQVEDYKKKYYEAISKNQNNQEVQDLRKSENELRDKLALSYSLIDDLKKQILDLNLKNQNQQSSSSHTLNTQEGQRRVVNTRIISQGEYQNLKATLPQNNSYQMSSYTQEEKKY